SISNARRYQGAPTATKSAKKAMNHTSSSRRLRSSSSSMLRSAAANSGCLIIALRLTLGWALDRVLAANWFIEFIADRPICSQKWLGINADSFRWKIVKNAQSGELIAHHAIAAHHRRSPDENDSVQMLVQQQIVRDHVRLRPAAEDRGNPVSVTIDVVVFHEI